MHARGRVEGGHDHDPVYGHEGRLPVQEGGRKGGRGCWSSAYFHGPACLSSPFTPLHARRQEGSGLSPLGKKAARAELAYTGRDEEATISPPEAA